MLFLCFLASTISDGKLGIYLIKDELYLSCFQDSFIVFLTFWLWCVYVWISLSIFCVKLFELKIRRLTFLIKFGKFLCTISSNFLSFPFYLLFLGPLLLMCWYLRYLWSNVIFSLLLLFIILSSTGLDNLNWATFVFYDHFFCQLKSAVETPYIFLFQLNFLRFLILESYPIQTSL